MMNFISSDSLFFQPFFFSLYTGINKLPFLTAIYRLFSGISEISTETSSCVIAAFKISALCASFASYNASTFSESFNLY